MTADSTRRYLALQSPDDRRLTLRALLARVQDDPDNDNAMTPLWWAIACDIHDLETAEAELRDEIDRL